MFQNIARDFEENLNEDVEFNKKDSIKKVIKKCFNKK